MYPAGYILERTRTCIVIDIRFDGRIEAARANYCGLNSILFFRLRNIFYKFIIHAISERRNSSRDRTESRASCATATRRENSFAGDHQRRLTVRNWRGEHHASHELSGRRARSRKTTNYKMSPRKITAPRKFQDDVSFGSFTLTAPRSTRRHIGRALSKQDK